MRWLWKYEKHGDKGSLDIKLEIGLVPVLIFVAVIALLIWSPW